MSSRPPGRRTQRPCALTASSMSSNQPRYVANTNVLGLVGERMEGLGVGDVELNV